MNTKEIKDEGFTHDMFAGTENDAELVEFIEAIIDKQSTSLQNRVGASIYADDTEPNKSRVKQAEHCLVVAEQIFRFEISV